MDWIQVTGSCEFGNEPLWPLKGQEMFQLAERILLYQEGFSSMELISTTFNI
jgi:hypothetical protein